MEEYWRKTEEISVWNDRRLYCTALRDEHKALLSLSIVAFKETIDHHGSSRNGECRTSAGTLDAR